MIMSNEVVGKKSSKKVNVGLNEDSHKIIKAFTESKGYNLSAFIEIAALARVKAESEKSVQ